MSEALKPKAMARRRRAEAEAGKNGATGAPQQPQAASQDKALPWYTPITSAPGNAFDIAKGVYNTVRHPLETAQGVDSLVDGAMRNGNAYLADKGLAFNRLESDDRQKQNMEVASQVGNQMYDNFSSPTRAWNTIATHPIDSLLAIAPGVGQLGKVAEAGGMARTAGILNKAASLDPAKPFEAMRSFAMKPIDRQTRLSQSILKQTLPKDLSAMDKIGPEAMLLDASPSMTGLARGVAANVGKGTDDMIGALLNREVGKSSRLVSGTDKIVGTSYDLPGLEQSIDRGVRKHASPLYYNAKKNAPNLGDKLPDILAKKLTDPSKSMSLENRGTMGSIMTQLDDALLGDSPRMVANRLHDVRKSLDAKIVHGGDFKMLNSADKAAQIPLKQSRKVIDDLLKGNLPGFAKADNLYATGAKAKDDLEFGRTALRGGESPVTPTTFGKEMAKRDKRFIKLGMTADIKNAMGTQSNDLIALKKKVGGDLDYNRSKIEAVYGRNNADKFVGMVDSEGAMSQNFADIARNSKTAQSLVAQDLIKGNKPLKVDSGATVLGMASKIPVAAANALIGKLSGRVQSTTSDALAKALVGKKPDVQELLRSLDKSGKVPLADKALIRALLFSGGLQASQVTP